jgi:hypothetical protein
MTDPPWLRPLPIRVPVADGESLHSWVEALAARYRMTVRELVPALGLRAPRTPYGLIRGIGDEALRSLERQTGTAAGRLDSAVLERYAALGLAGAPGRGFPAGRFSTWARASGSGFCPRCLTENGGRWSLSWHLNWTFACTVHNVLVSCACAACGRRPRAGENRLDHLIDPRRCCHSAPASATGRAGPRLPRCGASLAGQEPQDLDPSDPLLTCQRWLSDLIAAPGEVTVAGVPVPATAALGAVAALMRHVVVAGGGLPGTRPAGSPAGVLAAVAADPALFGAAAVLAGDVLRAPSMSSAADAASRMLHGREAPWPTHLDLGATGSPVLDAIILWRRAAGMSAADRLTYRTGNAVPRRPPGRTTAAEWPFTPGRLASVPARLVPQAAWKSVASALAREGDQDTGMLGVTLSMAIVRCGTRQEWQRVAASLVLPRQAGGTVSSVLRRLDSQGRLEQMLACIDALLEELTAYPPPIDYARRRHVFGDLGLLTRTRLRRACRGAGIVLTARRRRYVTMLLWETLTGGDIRFSTGNLAPRHHPDRARYAAFRDNEVGGLADYVALEAERLLLGHRIDEPVAWQPEPAGPAGTAWRSPPADLSRRLAGWNSPSRQGTLRRSARDHTPAAPSP